MTESTKAAALQWLRLKAKMNVIVQVYYPYNGEVRVPIEELIEWVEKHEAAK